MGAEAVVAAERRRGSRPPEHVLAALALEATLPKAASRDAASSKRRPAQLGAARIAALVREADRMRASADWGAAEAGHLVALHAWCSRESYGVDPGDLLDGRDWLAALGRARAFLARAFEAEPEACVDYLRWAWGRERAREKRRRQETNPPDARPLGWRLVFSERLLSDYRLHQARRRGQ